jgi:MCM P-loop domain
VSEYQAVEVLFARPSVDRSGSTNGNGDAAAYKNIKLTSVGRHDTMPNRTVRVVGALHPDPRKQLNEFLAWDVAQMETSLDRFEMNGKTMKMLQRFQPREGERPLKRLGKISRSLATHVTQIYGRPEMHAAMDMVFHSVLSFDFAGKRITRGWLDLLVLGDTRTGKSEAATRLTHHYGAGEVISCESASFAGIIGGLQQYGASKEWAVTWGAIPINDRRLVVLDEASGLTPEQIAEMSSVRSSGEAQLTKVQQERTYARTRLIWLANPRAGKMSDYTYGVQGIAPLIGNPEDIARFDLAMTVRAGEVPASEINRVHHAGRNPYTAEACAALLRWVWSRTPEQIVWDDDAEDEVFKQANKMGARYIEDPPLVQAANIREKIARMAVALAARTFSTDRSGERVVVRRWHVRDAVTFMDRIYGMPGFGYAERSREVLSDRKEAQKQTKFAKEYLYRKPGLAKFLRTTGKFRRQDLEEILNVDREQANAIISTLWSAKMVRKDKGDVRVEPTLHDILREVNV